MFLTLSVDLRPAGRRINGAPAHHRLGPSRVVALICSGRPTSDLTEPPPARPSNLLPAPFQAAASMPQMFQVQQIAASLVGFLCYKAAVVGVALVPPPGGGERSLLQQADAGGGAGGSSRADEMD